MEQKKKLLGIIPLLLAGYMAKDNAGQNLPHSIKLQPEGAISKVIELAKLDLQKYMPYKEDLNSDERAYDKQTHDKDYTKDYIRKDYEKQYKQYDKTDSNPSLSYNNESNINTTKEYVDAVINKYDKLI